MGSEMCIRDRINDEPRIKLSEEIEKVTRPGSKSILRFYKSDEAKKLRPIFDILCLEEEVTELIEQVNQSKTIEVVTSLKDGDVKDFSVDKIEEISELVYDDGKIFNESSLLDSRSFSK